MSAGALKRTQAQELARFADATGQGLTYIFFKRPTQAEINVLDGWIRQVAPNVSVTINWIYP